MPGSSAATVIVALSPALAAWRPPLATVLGPGYLVSTDPLPDVAVAVLGSMAERDVATLRRARPEIGIIIVVDESEALPPTRVVALLDAGADTCLVAPGPAGLGAHVRALARRPHPVRA